MNDIDLYFNLGNIGLGKKKPTNKLDVNGNIKSTGYLLSNSIINNINEGTQIKNNDSSYILSSKNKSIISTNYLGINNNDPKHTLDVQGDVRIKDNLYGNEHIIMSNNSDININPDSKYANVNFYSDVKILNDSNLSIGNIEKDIEKNSLSIKNKLYDAQGNQFIDFNNNNFLFNSDYDNTNKNITFHGPVIFNDKLHGVSIGDENVNIGSGELNVKNRIKTKKIQFSDLPDRMIEFPGNNASNIKLGEYTYLSNLSTNNDSNQSALFGHNLYANNNNIKIAKNSDNYGYRGISMNSVNGIQFYVGQESTIKNNIPNLPSVTISNSGQLIHTIPVLEYTDFNINDTQHNIYKYIKNELSNKNIGSMMTFTTKEYLTNDKMFNVIKNSATSAKCYIIDKTTNNVDQYFDIKLN